jgi:hypothetical protein
MTDLNNLTSPTSPLYLVTAAAINDRAEIVGTAVEQGEEPVGFLGIPDGEAQADDESPVLQPNSRNSK